MNELLKNNILDPILMAQDHYAKVVYEINEEKTDFIFREFDKVAERIDGIKASELVGNTLTSMFPGVKEFGLLDKLFEVYNTGRSTIHPNTLYKDSTHTGWRRNIIVKTSDKTLTVWYEDTEVEFNTHNTVEMFKKILKYTSDAIAITDSNAKIEYVNQQFINNTGYSEKELIGSNMSIIKSGDYDELFYQNMWSQLNNYQIFEDDLINKNKKGNLFIDHTIIIPIYGEDFVITNFVAIKKDITDQKMKEQIFRTHIREAQMGEMVSIIAHQWKQPLGTLAALNASLQLNSELDKLDSEKIKRHTTETDKLVQFMTATMDEFRNFYKTSKKEEQTYVKKLINESIFLIRNAINANKVDIEVNIPEILTIKTYKNEIKQVFINLIKNFVDIVNERTISNPKLIISTRQYQNSLEITFEDNGGGIEEKNLSKMFQPYFTTKNENDGTDLGLYMSKLVIEEHCNGHIDVKNSNNGAKFTITLNDL